MARAFKKLLAIYLITLFLIVIAPLGGFVTDLNHTTVISIRLDYLLHGLLFLPLIPLWRLGFPNHPLWLVLTSGIFLAIGLEGIQYLVPYRAYNVNDMLGNGAGVLLGWILVAIIGSLGILRVGPSKIV